MPSVAQDYHASSVIAVEDHAGMAVLVHKPGRYPSLVDDDGMRIERYIEVIQGGNGYLVSAVAGYGQDGRLMALHVGLAETMEGMRDLYPAALSAIDQAPMRYAEYHALTKRIPYVSLTREAYEVLAAEWGFAARRDADLHGYGVFSFPEYALADLPRLWIDQRRAWGVENEREKASAEEESASRARRSALAAVVVSLPVRTETRFVPLGLPGRFVSGGELCTVIARTGQRRITEDDASVHGSHLLGHEDGLGETVTIEIRDTIREPVPAATPPGIPETPHT